MGKNKLKILAARTHYKGTDGKTRLSAVDYYRVQNPLTHLAKNTNWKVEFVNKIVQGKDVEYEWDLIGKNYDIIYTSYMDTPKAYSYLKATCTANHAIHIMDLDDNIFEIDKANPAYVHYHPGSEFLENAITILQDVDYLTVSTLHLKDVCQKYGGRRKPIEVLPNFIDPDVFRLDTSKLPNNKGKIVIGYQGSSTHFADLFHSGFIWALRKVMMDYPHVYFKVIGCAMEEFYDYLPKDRIETIGGQRDFLKWIPVWQSLPFDIGVAPLLNSGFNRSKSSIKYYEYSLRLIPGVYSFVEPYINVVKENQTGFLARDEIEWEEKLRWYIENKKLRENVSSKAREDVLRNYTIQGNWGKWYDYISNIA